MNTLDQLYWDKRYLEGNTPWDIGFASPPITDYIDQLDNKRTKILIPGCGNGYEAVYLFENGFHNTFVIDISGEAITRLKRQVPAEFHAQLIEGDFFEHREKYDLIIEQTFFCALDPALRPTYVNKMAELLNHKGKLTGLLFDDDLNSDHPPYGGHKAEYLALFGERFDIHTLETAYNSIKPRAGRELFMIMTKKAED